LRLALAVQPKGFLLFIDPFLRGWCSVHVRGKVSIYIETQLLEE
jgi:hypothetical protein